MTFEAEPESGACKEILNSPQTAQREVSHSLAGGEWAAPVLIRDNSQVSLFMGSVWIAD